MIFESLSCIPYTLSIVTHLVLPALHPCPDIPSWAVTTCSVTPVASYSSENHDLRESDFPQTAGYNSAGDTGVRAQVPLDIIVQVMLGQG